MRELKAGRTLAALATAALMAGGAMAQGSTVTSGTGSTVTSGTGMAVTPGTAPAVAVAPSGTAVMGIGPALTTTTTTSARIWPEMPPNVESRRDFQRWLRLK